MSSRSVRLTPSQRFTVHCHVLGSGGEATVLAGSSVDGRQDVAIKILEPRHSRRTSEPTVLSRLSHRHVMSEPTVEHCPSSGRMYMIMERCQGDLFSRLEQGPMPEQEAKRVIKAVIEALVHCHEKGVAHLDVKHENILFRSNGDVVLADFGFAVESESPSSPPMARGRVGSHYFRAPEASKKGPDGRPAQFDGTLADVWSVGVVLMYCFTTYGVGVDFKGRRPAVVYPDRSLYAHLSEDAIDFVKSMLIIDPAYRPTARQLLTHRWLAGPTELGSGSELGIEADSVLTTGEVIPIPVLAPAPTAPMSTPASASASVPVPRPVPVAGGTEPLRTRLPCSSSLPTVASESTSGRGLAPATTTTEAGQSKQVQSAELLASGPVKASREEVDEEEQVPVISMARAPSALSSSSHGLLAHPVAASAPARHDVLVAHDVGSSAARKLVVPGGADSAAPHRTPQVTAGSRKPTSSPSANPNSIPAATTPRRPPAGSPEYKQNSMSMSSLMSFDTVSVRAHSPTDYGVDVSGVYLTPASQPPSLHGQIGSVSGQPRLAPGHSPARASQASAFSRGTPSSSREGASPGQRSRLRASSSSSTVSMASMSSVESFRQTRNPKTSPPPPSSAKSRFSRAWAFLLGKVCAAPDDATGQLEDGSGSQSDSTRAHNTRANADNAANAATSPTRSSRRDQGPVSGSRRVSSADNSSVSAL